MSVALYNVVWIVKMTKFNGFANIEKILVYWLVVQKSRGHFRTIKQLSVLIPSSLGTIVTWKGTLN